MALPSMRVLFFYTVIIIFVVNAKYAFHFGDHGERWGLYSNYSESNLFLIPDHCLWYAFLERQVDSLRVTQRNANTADWIVCLKPLNPFVGYKR